MPQRLTRKGLERRRGQKVRLTIDGVVREAPLFEEDNQRARLFIQVAKGARKYFPKKGDDVQLFVKNGYRWSYRHYTYAGAA